VTERAEQRLAVGVRHRWIVQPQNLEQRCLDRGDRPLPLTAIRKREASEGARRVVARDDLIPRAAAAPAIVPLVVTERLSGRHRGPPRHGVDRLWIQLDDLTRHAFPVTGHAECHSELAIDRVEGEARLVEREPRQSFRRLPILALQRRFHSDDGVDHDRVGPSRVLCQSSGPVPAYEVANAGRLGCPQVEDSLPGSVPERLVRDLHVHMVFI
jgi:hypothetical protein